MCGPESGLVGYYQPLDPTLCFSGGNSAAFPFAMEFIMAMEFRSFCGDEEINDYLFWRRCGDKLQLGTKIRAGGTYVGWYVVLGFVRKRADGRWNWQANAWRWDMGDWQAKTVQQGVLDTEADARAKLLSFAGPGGCFDTAKEATQTTFTG